MNLPGKATHFKSAGQVACGRVGVSYSTDKAAGVDCRQCRAALKRIANRPAVAMTRLEVEQNLWPRLRLGGVSVALYDLLCVVQELGMLRDG